MKMLLPLAAGIVVATIFKMTNRPALASFGRSCGVLTALTLGFFAHFALLNFAYADGEMFSQKAMVTVSQTTSQFLNPSTAIHWLPIIAKACVAVTWLAPGLYRSSNSISSELEGNGVLGSKLRSRWISVFIFGSLVLLVAGTIVRVLWSTVYFTDRYTLLSQTGLISIPAVIMGGIWMGGFRQSFHQQVISRWTVASTLVLSVSAMVLLATSGSFTFALLQIPVIAAATVGLVFFYSSTKRSPANHDAWLITCGICLPITLGFYFAEVRWETATLFAVAAAMTTWLAPKASDFNFKKAAIALTTCSPAIAAAVWSAIEFSQAVKSPYG